HRIGGIDDDDLVWRHVADDEGALWGNARQKISNRHIFQVGVAGIGNGEAVADDIANRRPWILDVVGGDILDQLDPWIAQAWNGCRRILGDGQWRSAGGPPLPDDRGG